MAARKKYATMSDTNITKYQCTNRKCKWRGSQSEKAKKRVDQWMTEDVCPKCGNNEFYGLLY